MSVDGDATVWQDTFPDELIPDILDVLCEVWRAFPKPSPTDEEVPINQRFCAALRQSRLRDYPLRLDPEVTLLDGDGKVAGRLDFRFTSACVKDEAYFAVECKRLYSRSKLRPAARCGATDYVRSGMLRYVKSCYAPQRDHGGMIGYVLSGSAARAISAVSRNIARHRGVLQLVQPGSLAPSSLRPGDPTVKETRHKRGEKVFQIHHLFLDCISPPLPKRRTFSSKRRG